jgi:hypothetical protein
MAHAGARAHALHVPRTDHRTVSHRVLVLQRAVEHVANDLHVAVAVGAEPHPWLHAVLVDHAQAPETHVARVVVVGEREGVEGAKPAVVGEAAFVGLANFDHVSAPGEVVHSVLLNAVSVSMVARRVLFQRTNPTVMFDIFQR